jgi:hypothetical protein
VLLLLSAAGGLTLVRAPSFGEGTWRTSMSVKPWALPNTLLQASFSSGFTFSLYAATRKAQAASGGARGGGLRDHC